MKRFTNILLLSLLSISVISCSNSNDPRNGVNVTKEEKEQIIESLLDNVHVSGYATQTLTYQEGYEAYNKFESFSFDKQYSIIKNKDNSLTNAYREFKNGTYRTYLESTNGEAIYEVYNTKNQVTTLPLLSGSMAVKYTNYFANPYLDASDIKNDLTLSNQKANLLLKSYFGIALNSKDAYFTYEDGNITGLNVTVSDQKLGLILYDLTELTGTLSTKVEIKFNCNAEKISHLTSKTNQNQPLKDAFNKLGSNYTLTLKSDNFSNDAVIYVAGNLAYLHYGVESHGPTGSDILLVKNSTTGMYDKYTYSSSKGELVKQSMPSTGNDVLPLFKNVKTELFDEASENTYVLDYAEAKLNAELLLIQAFNFYSGSSKKATVTLKDGNIDEIKVVIEASVPVIINEKVNNVGTTTLPSWLNLNVLN